MTLDSILINNSPESWDDLKRRYHQKLTATLYKPLTLDNIENFANTALADVVSLSKEVSDKYKAIQGTPTSAPNNKEAEDNAFNYYELPNIGEILTSINQVKEEIDQIKSYINNKLTFSNEVIIPTQSNTENTFGTRGGVLDNRKIFPRLLTLLYILKHDFGIEPEQSEIATGATAQDNLRKTPYVRLNIPDLDRLVYVCDEEGNASYIFNTNKLGEYKIDFYSLDHSNKNILNNLLIEHKDLGRRFIQTENWREQVKKYLQNDFVELESNYNSEESSDNSKPRTEFTSKSESVGLSYEDFQVQVKAQWLINGQNGQGGIMKWYKEEYKRKNDQGRPLHPGWQINSELKYKKQGKWKSWPELLGLEPERRKTFEAIESYSEFEKQVREQWGLNGGGSKSHWYLNEYKRKDENGNYLHPGWPAMPYQEYANKGWKSWQMLVGEKHERFKEFFETFEEFQKQVKTRWLIDGKKNIENIDNWYKTESEREDSEGKYIHPGWPANPRGKYSEVWEGWHKLLGIEGVKRESFTPPEYTEFEKQVRDEWVKTGDPKRSVVAWFRKECMIKDSNGEFIHKNWPYAPNSTYKDKGWKGWPAMVRILQTTKE